MHDSSRGSATAERARPRAPQTDVVLHVEAKPKRVVARQGVGLVTGSGGRNGAARTRVVAERRLDGALRLHVMMVLLLGRA